MNRSAQISCRHNDRIKSDSHSDVKSRILIQVEINRMTTAMMNGAARSGPAQRKSLAQQLDRMDQLLDGLSDGIQAAVVDAVKDAVGQAVQVALREVFTHPGVTARLAAPP